VLPGAIAEDARYLVRKSGKHPIYEVRYKASTHSREEIYVTILIIARRLNTVLGICIDDEDHQAHPSTSSVGRAIVVGDNSCVVE
jgi:hypothetical protein